MSTVTALHAREAQSAKAAALDEMIQAITLDLCECERAYYDQCQEADNEAAIRLARRDLLEAHELLNLYVNQMRQSRA